MYYKTNTKQVDILDSKLVASLYSNGFLFTRLGKGIMNQTRSLRINLSNFTYTSENKRILKKTNNIAYTVEPLPLQNYSWEIHKMGKEFYSTKFGEGTMSASKIKELFTSTQDTNFNTSFVYQSENASQPVGYAIVYSGLELLHYAYPFYNLEYAKTQNPNIGMCMMLKAIEHAIQSNLQYVYLGSVVDQNSKYKLQFRGLEWYNSETESWSTDLDNLKSLLV